jgi:hypothetical protein
VAAVLESETAPTGCTRGRSRLVENAVGAHLLNCLQALPYEITYWRHRTDEVDNVVRGGERRWAISGAGGCTRARWARMGQSGAGARATAASSARGSRTPGPPCRSGCRPCPWPGRCPWAGSTPAASPSTAPSTAGLNSNGQLGDGSTQTRSSPVLVWDPY